jgi:hypothetical protein
LPNIAPFAALNAGVYVAQTAAQANQHSLACGVRYDFAPHMDVKLQIDRVWLRQTNVVFDRNMPPADHAAMTVFSLAVDFAL